MNSVGLTSADTEPGRVSDIHLNMTEVRVPTTPGPRRETRGYMTGVYSGKDPVLLPDIPEDHVLKIRKSLH